VARLVTAAVAALVGVAAIVTQVVFSWHIEARSLPDSLSFWEWVNTGSGGLLLLSVLGGLGTNTIIAVGLLVSVQWIVDRERDDRQRQELQARTVANLLERSRLGSKAATEAFAELRAVGALTSGAMAGQTLSDLDMEGIDLSGAEFDGCHLDGASLVNCKLVGAKLRAASFTSASLDGANLSFADLTGADITEDALQRCGSLWHATLPSGQKYRGQWRLPLESEMAAGYGLDLDAQEDFRQFFGT